MKRILLLGILAAFTLINVNAQKKAEYYVFTTDTLTDAGTVNFECPYDIKGTGNTISWQVEYTQISGTSAFTANRQQSNRPAGTLWTTFENFTTADTLLNGTAYGYRERLSVVGSGTQSTKLEVVVIVQRP